MDRQYQAGTKKGYRQSWQKRALSWCIGLLQELRVPVVQTNQSSPSAKRFSFPFGRDVSSGSHVAAICYRRTENGIQFLLVRTRAGRWTFPKGRVDGDPSRAAAAAREAYEEAGVFGRVESRPIGRYLHSKMDQVHFDEHAVDAHLCEVIRMVPPEEMHRDPTWFDPEKTKRRLCERRKPKYANEITSIVDQAVEYIARRRH
jgi:8-oxo-dGTP pyrophosphatase MutT (NUDIX family)